MKPIHALTGSMKLDNLKPAIYIWFFNLITGTVGAYVTWCMYSITSGKSIIPQISESGSIFIYLTDMFFSDRPIFMMAMSIIIVLVFFFMLASIFLSGGIYALFVNSESKTFGNFVGLSSKYFFRLIPIFLVNLIGWIFLLFILLATFLPIKNFVFETGNEMLAGVFLYAWSVVTFLLMVMAMAVYDFSRIILIKTENNFFHCYLEGFRFLMTHKRVVFSILGIYSLIIIIFHIMVHAASARLEPLMPLFFFWIIFQVFIIAKFYLKTLLMNTETNLMVTESETQPPS